MKHTTRKKMLVSSVAMLLVAMLALGSATYAWFSTNTKATASGITAKTSQASNIVLSETGTDGWTDKLTFTADTAVVTGTMTPATTKDFSDWYTAVAEGLNTGIANNDGLQSEVTAGEHYLTTELYVKYDAPSTDSVTVDISTVITDKKDPASSNKNFIRAALVPDKAQDAPTKSLTNAVYGNAKDDFAADPSKFTALDAAHTDADSIVTSTNGKLINSLSLTGGTVYHFSVFVWYEGTDPDCIDANSNNEFAVSYEVTKSTTQG